MCTPAMIFSAFSQATYQSLFFPILSFLMQNSPEKYPELQNDINLQNVYCLWAMTFLGIGEILGYVIVGLIIDKLSVKIASFL